MVALSISLIDLVNEPVSPKMVFQNWGFILFLFCFFIVVYAISAGPRLITQMIKSLLGTNSRESIFSEQIDHEFIIKLLLCLQTTVLCSIILFNYYSYQSDPSLWNDFQFFPFFLKASLLIIAFLLYKAFIYNLVGNIFFTKENLKQWNDYFLSVICFSGFVLFFPVLLQFYIEKIFYFCHIFYLIYSFFIIILISRKIFVLFFPNRALLLHFILYLCAQEIIPLYFLYKGLDYLFIV